MPLPVSPGGTTWIDLPSLPVAGARQLTYQLSAVDNMPQGLGGPQVGMSLRHVIELTDDAEDYLAQIQLAIELRIRQALQEALAELHAAKTLSDPLRRLMGDLAALDGETLEQIDQCRRHLTAAETTVRQLSGAVGTTQFAFLAPRLDALQPRALERAAA